MSKVDHTFPFERRKFIKLLATSSALGAVCSFIPGHTVWAIDSAITANAAFSTFLKVSETICGYSTLDSALGQRIFTLMQQRNASLGDQLNSLQSLLNADMSSAEMQGKLQSVDKNQQALFSDILRAWQLGIVGTGKEARVVAYEFALMYKPIADVIVLPTYAHGEPHYWAHPPVFKNA